MMAGREQHRLSTAMCRLLVLTVSVRDAMALSLAPAASTPRRARDLSSPIAASSGLTVAKRGSVIVPWARSANRAVPYWFDPRIHNFGNVGVGGRFHSLVAPVASKIIDQTAYGGLDVRQHMQMMLPASSTVLDLCCGIGFSTTQGGVGVDTSPAMLDVARLVRPDCKFHRGNAESFGVDNSFDVVTCAFATHEVS